MCHLAAATLRMTRVVVDGRSLIVSCAENEVRLAHIETIRPLAATYVLL